MTSPLFTKPAVLTLEVCETLNIAGFTSRCDKINSYVHERLVKELRINNAKCFYSTPIGSPNVLAGFYTLRNKSLRSSEVFTDGQRRRKVENLPTISCIELCHFGVDIKLERQGLGDSLLADAEERYLKTDISGAMLHLISTPNASSFYQERAYQPLKPSEVYGGCNPYYKLRSQMIVDRAQSMAAAEIVPLPVESVVADAASIA